MLWPLLDYELPDRQSHLQALIASIFHSINLEYLLSYKDKEGKRPSLKEHTVCLCDGNMGSHEGTAGTEVQGGNPLTGGLRRISRGGTSELSLEGWTVIPWA